MKLIRLIGTAALISSLPVASLAAGSLHVNGATASQLELADHKVTVTIDNQVAITRVVQVSATRPTRI